MTEVVPQRLWLGHAGDVRDWRTLLGAGVRAVVDLALNEPAQTLPRELIYCRVPLIDGSDNPPETLRLAVDIAVSLLRASAPTLVCCSAGMSRSLAIGAAAWAVVSQSPPEDCLRSFAARRPHDLSPGLWHSVLQTVFSRQ